MNFEIPRIPLGDWIEAGLDFFTDQFSGVTRAFSAFTRGGISLLNDGLLWLSPWAIIIAVCFLCWRAGGIKLAVFAFLGLGLVLNMGLWDPMIQTLTLVVVATLIAIMIALPLGILAALSGRFYKMIMPILDFMQTMPAFVYLIPAIPFFGIGAVSGIFATVIFSMPPAIRFTALGIRQVPGDLMEAADAYGSTRTQKLFKLQLPLSLPTIMAGINQTIMLALSMVVIAAMIGADGLGTEVWRAIQRLQPGSGFEAGIAVVILAMLLDRLTQALRRQSPAE